eukprot:2512980-Rhodomonas_salina.2
MKAAETHRGVSVRAPELILVQGGRDDDVRLQEPCGHKILVHAVNGVEDRHAHPRGLSQTLYRPQDGGRAARGECARKVRVARRVAEQLTGFVARFKVDQVSGVRELL